MCICIYIYIYLYTYIYKFEMNSPRVHRWWKGVSQVFATLPKRFLQPTLPRASLSPPSSTRSPK